MVEIPPDGYKRMKNSRKMQMVFFVHEGKVTVDIEDVQFGMTKGGVWQVPRGEFFSFFSSSFPASSPILCLHHSTCPCFCMLRRNSGQKNSLHRNHARFNTHRLMFFECNTREHLPLSLQRATRTDVKIESFLLWHSRSTSVPQNLGKKHAIPLNHGIGTPLFTDHGFCCCERFVLRSLTRGDLSCYHFP
jgi:hypothetical protein